jgi:hypothetical protein
MIQFIHYHLYQSVWHLEVDTSRDLEMLRAAKKWK